MGFAWSSPRAFSDDIRRDASLRRAVGDSKGQTGDAALKLRLVLRVLVAGQMHLVCATAVGSISTNTSLKM